MTITDRTSATRHQVSQQRATPPPATTTRHGVSPARCGCASATATSSRSTSTRSSRPSAALPRRPRRRRPDARRHPHDLAACTTAPPRRSSTSCRSAPRPRSSARSRTTRRLAARLLATVHRQGGRQPGHPLVLPVDRRRPRAPGSIGDDTAELVAANARKLNEAIDHRARLAASSSSACAPSTTATCCATPRRRAGHRDPAVLLPAGRLRPVDRGRRGDRALPADLVARLPAVDARRCSTRGTTHPQMSSCYLLDSPERHPRRHLRPLHGHRPAVEVRRRHRRRLPPRAQPRARSSAAPTACPTASCRG